MQLVVDTNILISFFRDNPVKFIIINSKLLNLELFIPEHSIDELKKNELDILKYGKINSRQFEDMLINLAKFIKIFPKESFKDYELEAKELIHEKDTPFFALALSLNCAIWSNEPAFKEQSKIKIFSTSDLRDSIKL